MQILSPLSKFPEGSLSLLSQALSINQETLRQNIHSALSLFSATAEGTYPAATGLHRPRGNYNRISRHLMPK